MAYIEYPSYMPVFFSQGHGGISVKWVLVVRYQIMMLTDTADSHPHRPWPPMIWTENVPSAQRVEDGL